MGWSSLSTTHHFGLILILSEACRFSEMSMMVESLSIFYTQRDNLFYPAWAFALPTTLLRIPYSLLESFLWSIIVYWSVGLAPTAARFFTFWLLLFLSHQAWPPAPCHVHAHHARLPARKAHALVLLSARALIVL